jgi:ring-1,2-phenylacetyl-CoA epoxidase subunit PaaA
MAHRQAAHTEGTWVRDAAAAYAAKAAAKAATRAAAAADADAAGRPKLAA